MGLGLHDHSFQMKSAADGQSLQVYAWHATAAPRGCLVIAHGAAEHALRYDRFASALVGHGLEVIALDHRGHGRSPGPEGVGDFGKAGWAGLVSDLGQLIDVVRATHSSLPVALLAHSMGSFAAQQLCHTRSASIDALVLSGSTVFDPSGEGEDGDEGLELDLNAPFEPARTAYDWLSRDESEVDRYVADPCCGFESQPNGRIFSFEDLVAFGRPEGLRGARADLPVLIASGAEDPLHRQGSGLLELERRWREAGVRRVDTRVYPGARHELLNELNRDEVTDDVRTWLLEVLPEPGVA